MEKNRIRRKQCGIKSHIVRDDRNEREEDDMLKESERILRDQGNTLSKAESAIDVLGEQLAHVRDNTISVHSGRKQSNINTRMMAFEAIINQVPTMNIPVLMQSYSTRLVTTLDYMPHCTALE